LLRPRCDPRGYRTLRFLIENQVAYH